MRRAELEEREVHRLADMADDAGVSMGALGSFTDLASLEAALRDAMRAPA